MISMGLAGAVVKRGGMMAAFHAQKYAMESGRFAGKVDQGIKSFRKVEAYLDELQGITRAYENNDPTKLFEKVGRTRQIRRTDRVTTTDGFNFRVDNPTVPAWKRRDEVQQRLVRQARRLPYELPGFYAAQRAILDPMLGVENEGPDWSNPIDVVGDFASESIKMLATNVIPFEAGQGVAKQGYRNLAMKLSRNPGNSVGVETTRAMLEQLGASATDIMNRTMRLSHQSIGAFSSMVDDAIQNQRTQDQVIRSASTQATHAKPQIANAGFARRSYETFKQGVKNLDLRRDQLDALPGPFKGMGTAVRNVKKNFKDIGRTYDDWQDVISGRKTAQSIRNIDQKRYDDLVGFMERGGGTFMEKFARDANNLGGVSSLRDDGTLNPAFRGTDFYKGRRNYEYQQILIESLSQKTGLQPQEALKFVQQATKIEAFNPNKGGKKIAFGQGIVERIQYGKNPFVGKKEDWWDNLVKEANAHKIPLGTANRNMPVSQSAFVDAVRNADVIFSSNTRRQIMDTNIAKEWDHIVNKVIPEKATSAIDFLKQPYERFQGSALKQNREYLVKRSAQRLNIDINNSSGVALPLRTIEDRIRKQGIEPTNLYTLRGFLMDQKDISAPWTRDGRNLFGFKPLSMSQAVSNGFFSTSPLAEQELISKFVDYKASAASNSVLDSSVARMKVGGVYTNADGTVVDLGRMRRSVSNFVDTLANETKIPILNFNPLQLMWQKTIGAQRRAPSIQMLSPHSNQPFVSPGNQRNDNFLLWVRDRANKSKGEVHGFSDGGFSGIQSHKYDGLFRSFMTNDQTMAGHLARVVTGDMGLPSSSANLETMIPGIEGRTPTRGEVIKGRLRSLFDVAYDQEGSMFLGEQSALRRWKMARKGAGTSRYTNPNNLAGRLASDDPFHPAEFTPAMTQGMEDLVRTLRNFGFSSSTLKNISESSDFADIFQPLGGVNLFDIHASALPRVAKELLDSDQTLFRSLSSRSTRSEANKLQQQLSNLLDQGKSQDGFWSLAATRTGQVRGVSRRIDELRNDLASYLVSTSGIRTEINTGVKSRGIDDTITRLFTKIDDMTNTGQISRAERGEARAAVLSLQVEQMRNRAYSELAGSDSGVVLFELNTKLAQALTEGGPVVKAVLQEVADFKPGAESGPKDFVRRAIRKGTTTVPYRRNYEVNPIGDNFLLVPTIGTVNQRSGIFGVARGAIGGWGNPETTSSATMVAAQMSVRLNRYVESLGLGLDPSRYNGPLDFYARGLIGRRVAPAFIAGTTAVALDRTAGGLVNKDENGNPIYAPLVLGKAADAVAAGQSALAGLIPGGQTAQEKREELTEGEVPIRSGRYWLLGSEPFKGGRIQYFRPSWYQRFKSGASYAPEMNETPMERLMFGYDFSPLRPLDPYRREREDALSRPYPVSGDYFTGPWGMLNPILNSTVGRVLKPRREMNQDLTQQMLAQYAPVGQSGAYQAGGSNVSPSSLMVGNQLSTYNSSYQTTALGTGSAAAFYPALGYAAPRGRASQEVRQRATLIASTYSARAQSPGSYVSLSDTMVPYGVPVASGYMSPRIVPSGAPITTADPSMRARDLGYRTQETLGIYGFAFGNLRSSLGFGSLDYAPDRAVLEPASRGYSSARAFWGLNIGGLGDVPLSLESKYSNFELSEIVRRFVPRDPSGVSYVNDLPNLMGQMYPWLPGADYPLASVKTGDPYTSAPDAEIRLPGTGYARTNQLFSDKFGQIGLVNIHDILGSIAPWSKEFEQVDGMVDAYAANPLARAKINQTRAQVEAMRVKTEFTPYEYKHKSPLEITQHPAREAMGRFGEWIEHRDTFFNQKLLPVRTAVEDWEREHVYGATFPSWQRPYESYIQPFVNKSTQRNPASAVSAGAALGFLFGASPRAKLLGAVTGGVIGGAASVYGKGYEAITGDRYLPAERRKEIALEEYCLPDTTKVLTKRGWITCYELTYEDEIMTFNPDTEQAEWQRPINISMFDGVREMEYWKSRSIEVMSTLTHRWMVRNTTSKKIRFKTTETITNTNPVVIGGGDFSGVYPSASTFDDEFVELVAWVMTEGYLRSSYAMEVSQKSTSPWIIDIENIVNFYQNLGAKVTRHVNGEQFTYYFPRIVSDEVRKYVDPITKAVDPKFISSLTEKQAVIFYETCLKADGWQTGNSDYFGQKEMDRVENFQMIAALLGYRTNVYSTDPDWFDVGVQKKFNTLQFHRSESTIRERIVYEGVVWCPTTPNGTWMANYNGSIFWTGNTDILKYTRATLNAQRAQQVGNGMLAQQFLQESKQTMYGADFNSTPEQLAMAVPERKREHFRAMLYAPEQEREQILSTAGRLERRLFQAAWGMRVESRPNLPEYFEDHELPPIESSVWNPLTDLDQVKIKVGQHMGLDMAQMGYYPQQIQEANLVNPSYPDMLAGNYQQGIMSKLRQMLFRSGGNGDVQVVPNMFGYDRVELNAGVYQ